MVGLEELGLIRRGDARAFVANADAGKRGIRSCDLFNGDGGVGRGKLDRVGDQVVEHLSGGAVIGLNPERVAWFQIHLQLDLLGVGVGPVLLHHHLQDLGQRDGGDVELQRGGPPGAVGETVLNQAQ